MLKEDDILRVGRLILPAANLAISKTRLIFSGEPAMTLKVDHLITSLFICLEMSWVDEFKIDDYIFLYVQVVPFLLVGAEYGHLITLWRLCALGKALNIHGLKSWDLPKFFMCEFLFLFSWNFSQGFLLASLARNYALLILPNYSRKVSSRLVGCTSLSTVSQSRVSFHPRFFTKRRL